jgi:hypothetical protein
MKMSQVRVPTDREWTADALIKALQGVSGDTKLIFGTSTKTAAATGTCWCGCGAPTAKKFAPGHDARFHGLAKKVARGQAHRPASFVSPEAEADFEVWVERTRREDATKVIASPIATIAPVLRPAAVIKSIEPTVEEPAEGAGAEALIATMEAGE